MCFMPFFHSSQNPTRKLADQSMIAEHTSSHSEHESCDIKSCDFKSCDIKSCGIAIRVQCRTALSPFTLLIPGLKLI